jgi:mono/diheme cytochrome c family protein
MQGRALSLLASAAFVGALAQPLCAQDQRTLEARGEYLVNGPAGCGNCHTRRGPDLAAIAGMYLAGGNKFDIPPGLAYSKNITPDTDTGIGGWTDQQIIRAIREGVTKEGNIIGPPMPVALYNKISDDDAKAIVAYLRSIKPIRNEVPESKYRIALHAQPPAKGLPAPSKADKAAYGEYLVNMAHCLECHTPNSADGEPDYANRSGAGGRPFFPIPDKPVHSANISSDPETGIGRWTDEEVKRAITQGINRDGKQLIPPMPYAYFKNMAAEDVDAMIAFIRTLPPQKNKVQNPSLQSYLQ